MDTYLSNLSPCLGIMDIYQEIWDTDQNHSGLKAVRKDEEIDQDTKDTGYVVVDEKDTEDEDHKVIVEVHIPANKQESYGLVETLFNNYVLDQTKPEINTARELKTEEQEIQSFIEYVYKTPPMDVARKYYSEQTRKKVTDDEWWAITERIWFAQYDDGGNKDLSGFEHVVVGEQKQGRVQGYHFWYKYYLDENHFGGNDFLASNNSTDSSNDLIKFLGWKGQFNASPECVTLSYVWEAPDYKNKKLRKLTKPIGGFWVGPSIEGLMALGNIRFLEAAFSPKKATINDVTYNLKLYRSPDDRHLRTFYPEQQ